MTPYSLLLIREARSFRHVYSAHISTVTIFVRRIWWIWTAINTTKSTNCHAAMKSVKHLLRAHLPQKQNLASQTLSDIPKIEIYTRMLDIWVLQMYLGFNFARFQRAMNQRKLHSCLAKLFSLYWEKKNYFFVYFMRLIWKKSFQPPKLVTFCK